MNFQGATGSRLCVDKVQSNSTKRFACKSIPPSHSTTKTNDKIASTYKFSLFPELCLFSFESAFLAFLNFEYRVFSVSFLNLVIKVFSLYLSTFLKTNLHFKKLTLLLFANIFPVQDLTARLVSKLSSKNDYRRISVLLRKTKRYMRCSQYWKRQ